MRKWQLLLIVVLWWLWPATAAKASGAGFTVTPQLPAEQIGENRGWFDLLAKPGQQLVLSVVVANDDTTAKHLKLQLTDAYTQANGQIGYAPNQQPLIEATTRLTKLGSKPVTITLAPHTGRTVTFQVQIPAIGLSGQVLGAIYVEDLTTAPQASASGFAVANAFAMVVAVQLQTNQTPPAPLLRLAKVTPKATAVIARIENPRPRLFGQITYQAKLTAVGDTKAIATQQDRNMQMAPNSAFDYQIALSKPLAAGRYQLTLTATAGDKRWVMTKAITITAQAAAKAGAKTGTSWWWIGFSGLGIVALIAAVWWRKRRYRA
ncbi:DUF916 and DUF3324 domain-containing protein [Lacticaseibacillus jixiensis]|uniref:DUF916 and DUF3324 domain-containing protein n=1 Tax=Lacticaseibacillus jixiensis TaxID=3231926 RepID=UPI0036F3B7BC